MPPSYMLNVPLCYLVKICDLALYSWAASSGVRTYIESKIEYVRRRPDLEHVVIVPDAAHSVSQIGRTKMIRVAGVRSPYPGVHLALNVVRVARLIESESPDLIEVNCQYTLAWAAFLATRQRRVPVVGVYHTDVPACVRHWTRALGATASTAVERLVESYEGLIYRRCTLTILLHEGLRQRVERLGVRRVEILPCGVNTAIFHPGQRSAAFRCRQQIAPTQTAVLYAGRFSPEKEVDVLIAAFEQLPAHRFVLLLAGDGPDVDGIARYASGHPHVRYLGHLDRQDLATAYASSDVFVTPGRFETFGMSTLEALSCGLPVVGIRDSGTSALVPAHLGRLTAPGDPAAMAHAIREVADGAIEATREAAHAFAAQGFSWDHVLDQYLVTYRRLLERSVAPMEVTA
ncbi:MAG TPA: glycosyltransferase [Vicinamibacterales bacterium]